MSGATPHEERRPRALLVGDNRGAPNWGGRSTGLALIEVLNREFDVASTIEGREFRLESAGYGIVGTCLPSRFDHWALYAWLNSSRRRPFRWYAAFERAMGARDFVCPDPDDTVAAILRYRHQIPEIDGLYRRVAEADVVVINGEGDFVFTTPPRREALFMLGVMALAFHLRKTVFLVNAMMSDCPVTGRNAETVAATERLLRRCTRVVLRDPESIAYIRANMPGLEVELIPDALFAWSPDAGRWAGSLPDNGDLILPHPARLASLGRLDLSRPYIAVGGTAAALLDRPRAIECYSHLVQRLQSLGYPVYLTENDGPDEFLSEVSERTRAPLLPVLTPIHAAAGMLGRARLFVSGRYHPAIMASLAGTPCLFLGSTAHKMTSVQALLGYEPPRTFAAFPSDTEIDDMVAMAKRYLDAGQAMRDSIARVVATRCDEVSRLPDLLVVSRPSLSPSAA